MTDKARTRERTRPTAPAAPAARTRSRGGSAQATATIAVVERKDQGGRRNVESVVKEEVKTHTVRIPERTIASYIEIGAGATYNTGHYSSVRVDVRVNWPFPVDLDWSREQAEVSLEESYTWLAGRVEGIFQREADAALEPSADDPSVNPDDVPV